MKKILLGFFAALLAATAAAQQTPVTVFDQNGNYTTVTITSPTMVVPSITGPFTVGHLATIGDTNGSLVDNPRPAFSGAGIIAGTMPWESLIPTYGYYRPSPCSLPGSGSGNAYYANCGPTTTNPAVDATVTLHVSDCGNMQGTNGIRTPANVHPAYGAMIVLPAPSDFSSNVPPVKQCQISVIMPEVSTQFVCFNPNGGKFTATDMGIQVDIFSGCYYVPLSITGIASVIWDGTSWTPNGGTPNTMAWMGQGQLPAQGQNKLSLVASGALAGYTAYCNFNGTGQIVLTKFTDATGVLHIIPPGCVYNPAGLSSSTGAYQVLNFVGTTIVSNVTAGPANGVGGNYVHIKLATSPGLSSGDTVECYNIKMNGGGGTLTNSFWTAGNVPNPPDGNFDLITQVRVDGHTGLTSSFVPGDTFNPQSGGSGAGTCGYMALKTDSIGSRITDQQTGVEVEGASSAQEAVVGFTNGVTFTDSPCTRYVASLFNAALKGAGPCTYTASGGVNPSTSATTWTALTTNPSNQTPLNFVYMTPPTTAALNGAAGAGVPWSATFTVSNTGSTSNLSWAGGTATATVTVAHGVTVGATFTTTIAGASPSGYNGTYTATATDATHFTYAIANPGSTPASGTITYTSPNECDVAGAFDPPGSGAVTPETGWAVVFNSLNSFTIGGVKQGLTEGVHHLALTMQSPGGTKCTLNAATTTLSAQLWQ